MSTSIPIFTALGGPAEIAKWLKNKQGNPVQYQNVYRWSVGAVGTPDWAITKLMAEAESRGIAYSSVDFEPQKRAA